ncbi:MAG: hypothetical protein ACREL5_08110 [Gemmatimonadales bacterium]
MSIAVARTTIATVLLAVISSTLVACTGKHESLTLLQKAVADRAAAGHDPCTLLTAAEAQPYVGPLASPPYRASDGAADVHGDQCIYRGTDGREIAIEPDWSGGGASAGAAVQGAVNALGQALSKGGASGMDTMAHRVVKAETDGPWDRATWIPGGSLIVSKGDVTATIDVSGASGEEHDAIAVAKVVMPRFDHPLAYDGGKAVALVPKPPAHPAHACDFLPLHDVETAIGPLDGAPTSDDPETTCTYRVRTAQGEATYPVEFVWQGGQKNYAMLKHGMAMMSGMLGTPASTPLDTMTPPPQMQAAIGSAMRMLGRGAGDGAGGAGGGGGAAAAPGAAATIGFQTDTTLAGPWDNAALLHGTQLIAVRHDVFVGMSLQSADYQKAKALLAAITSRL